MVRLMRRTSGWNLRGHPEAQGLKSLGVFIASGAHRICETNPNLAGGASAEALARSELGRRERLGTRWLRLRIFQRFRARNRAIRRILSQLQIANTIRANHVTL